jgi:glycerophosphoryl diester phosphodiesterase
MGTGTAAAESGGANPWPQLRFLNMAHAGGENEAPANTMYAFKRAVRLGADMIELDVESTADDRLVVIHNSSVDATTNGTGLVKDMTFRQVHALDAAYNRAGPARCTTGGAGEPSRATGHRPTWRMDVLVKQLS